VRLLCDIMAHVRGHFRSENLCVTLATKTYENAPSGFVLYAYL
jgi:hypothetical protein